MVLYEKPQNGFGCFEFTQFCTLDEIGKAKKKLLYSHFGFSGCLFLGDDCSVFFCVSL
jgi:hypothetical protein